jgi:hypothetical protein
MSSRPRGPLTRAAIAMAVGTCVLAVQAIVPLNIANAQSLASRSASIPHHRPIHLADPTPPKSRPVPWSAKSAMPVLHIHKMPNIAALRRTAIAHAGATDKFGTYRVSPAFLTLLDKGLGMDLGQQTLFAGAKSGSFLKVGLPGPQGLRLGISAAPHFTSSVLTIDPANGAATLTASRSGAALNVTVPNVAGAVMAGVTGELTLPVRVPGQTVTLSGPVSYHDGSAVTASLAGHLAATDVLKRGVAELSAGTTVTLSPEAGVRITGPAELGPAGRQLEAIVSGAVEGKNGWTLDVRSVGRRAPLPGLTLTPNASGTVTDSRGRIGYDVLAHTTRTWSAATGVTLSGAITFADGRFPTGGLIPAPGITGSTPWMDIAGPVSVNGITTHGIAAINLASGKGLLTSVGKTPVTLKTAEGKLITDAAGFRGALDVNPSGRLVASIPAGMAAWAPHSTHPARTSSRAPTDGTSGSYTLSSSVYNFITNTLNIPINSATLNGSVSNGTLTLSAGGPTSLPSSLPSWIPNPAYVNTQISVNESTNTLTLIAATGTSNGETATLTITIANASASNLSDGTDVSGTFALTGVPFAGGSTAALTFALGYTGSALSASLNGTLTTAATFGAVTIPAGAMLGLGTGSGLTISGTADFTAGDNATSVLVKGTLTDLSNWSLNVTTDPNADSWTPATGLSITPDFTGSITDKAGTVGFDVVSQEPNVATWISPDGSSMVTVNSIEVSNQAPASGANCSTGQVKDGDLWVGIGGSYDYSPANLNLNATGCFDLTGRSASITTQATGNLNSQFSNLPFTVTNVGLAANVASGGTFSLTGSATVTITQGLSTKPSFNVALSLSNSGIVAGVTLPDLSSLGFTGAGALYISTEAISGFDPSTIGLTGQSPFDLPAGLSATLKYTLPSDVLTQIQKAIPSFPDKTGIQATASLSTSGFTVSLEVPFGTGANGVTVFNNNGSALYLDDIMVTLQLGTVDQLSLSGTGYLQLPPVSPGGVTSDVTVTLSAGFNFTTDTFAFTFDASNWDGAFGVNGFNIGDLSGSVTVTGELVPGIALSGSQIVLPSNWATAIGMVPGTEISFNVSLELTNPQLGFTLENPAGPNYPTLMPLSLVNSINPQTISQNVVDSFLIDEASFSIAPSGGSLVFIADVDNVSVNVNASVQLGTSPSVTAMVSAPPFTVGQVQVSDTEFNLSVSTSGFSLELTGGAAYQNYSFQATIGMALGNSMNGANLSLAITGGLPSYFAAGATLSGAVSGDGGTASINANGSGWLSAGGTTLGPVSFSLSIPNGGLSWSDVSDSITTLASFFVNNVGLSASQVLQAMEQFGYSMYDTFNALSDIGDYGQQILSDLASAFGLSTTYFNIWTYTSSGQILTLDVDGGSQSPNANVITWLYNGGYNQEWAFVQSPYSGWYEIVNRGSGQCLTVEGNNSTPGNPLIQYPCAGAWNQLWYMGNIALNTNYVISSALDDEVADVQNAYPWEGGYLDQWSYNGGWNQQFWLTNGEN